MNMETSSSFNSHPGEVSLRPWRRALLVIRPIQVILNFIGFIISAVALTSLGIATAYTNKAIIILEAGGKLPEDGVYTDDQGKEHKATLPELYEERRVLGVATGISAVSLALFLTTTALSIVWLVYTLSPKARGKASCFGRKRNCANYTADLVSDAVLAVIWLVIFILACVYSGVIGIIVVQALLFVSYVITAIVSHRIRKLYVQAASLAGDSYYNDKGSPYPAGANSI